MMECGNVMWPVSQSSDLKGFHAIGYFSDLTSNHEVMGLSPAGHGAVA